MNARRFEPRRRRPHWAREAAAAVGIKLPGAIHRQAAAMAGSGGIGGVDIYERLNARFHGIDKAAFVGFVEAIHAAAGRPADAGMRRIAAVADAFRGVLSPRGRVGAEEIVRSAWERIANVNGSVQ